MSYRFSWTVRYLIGAVQGHDFGINRKRVWDFLLLCHSNVGPIVHRFLAKKLQIFSYPTLIRRKVY